MAAAPTWYTGSAGWMYRLIVESLLGLTLQVDDDGARLLVRPCLPVGWTGYHVDYRFRETTYRIDIERARSADPSVTMDGELQPGDSVPLVDDGRTHAVRVVLSPQLLDVGSSASSMLMTSSGR
jgi:cyclic beta-1,2-glucan synthetase